MRDVTDVIVAIYQLGVEEASDAELREVIEWLQCELDNRAEGEETNDDDY